ncbi:MAG: hypothetical protein HYS38_08885 [Acidobacteria bacterium]|nr:hypothetical protein [Acidobacteriota bacterium]
MRGIAWMSALVILVAPTLLAGELYRPVQPTPRIDRLERHEQRRIRQGIRSGELTPQEVRHLEKEQARIRVEEARAKSDGTVTRAERRRLVRDLNRASRNIYRQKHDRQHRR